MTKIQRNWSIEETDTRPTQEFCLCNFIYFFFFFVVAPGLLVSVSVHGIEFWQVLVHTWSTILPVAVFNVDGAVEARFGHGGVPLYAELVTTSLWSRSFHTWPVAFVSRLRQRNFQRTKAKEPKETLNAKHDDFRFPAWVNECCSSAKSRTN